MYNQYKLRSEFVRIYNIRSQLQSTYDNIHLSCQDKSPAKTVLCKRNIAMKP